MSAESAMQRWCGGFLGMFVLANVPGMAYAEVHSHAPTALYADASQPDISGLWVIQGAFTFSPQGTLPKLLGSYKALYERRMKAFDAGTPIDDVTANCLPAGMPHLAVVPYPFEIMQTVGRITLLYEYDSVVRRIALGSGHPDPGRDAPPFTVRH